MDRIQNEPYLFPVSEPSPLLRQSPLCQHLAPYLLLIYAFWLSPIALPKGSPWVSNRPALQELWRSDSESILGPATCGRNNFVCWWWESERCSRTYYIYIYICKKNKRTSMPICVRKREIEYTVWLLTIPFPYHRRWWHERVPVVSSSSSYYSSAVQPPPHHPPHPPLPVPSQPLQLHPRLHQM